MTIYITAHKKQELSFDFEQDLDGETGTFYLKLSGVTVFSKELTAVDASAGTFTLSLTSTETIIDLSVYDYQVDFDVTGTVETGECYLIENEDLRIEEIKEKYKLVFDKATMTRAFNKAKNRTIKFLYSDGEDKEYSTNNNLIEIDNFVADNNNYGFVCKDSIRVYEYTTIPPYSTTELNNNISTIEFDYPTGKTIITMDDDYPSSGSKLKVEYKKVSVKFDSELYETVKYIQELYTYLYLLETLTLNKLQLGFTTKSINNVTFDFNKESIDDLKIKIRQWIENEAIEFEEILINDVTLSNDY